MRSFFRLFFFITGLLISKLAFAEYHQIDLTIYGMDWGICAHAVSVALKKTPGVETVEVSLNKGLATIHLKPGNTVKLQQIRKSVEDKGFTPKDAKVRLTARIVNDGGHLSLKVSEANESFAVKMAAEGKKTERQLQELINKNVVVEGIISSGKEGKSTPSISILDFH